MTLIDRKEVVDVLPIPTDPEALSLVKDISQQGALINSADSGTTIAQLKKRRAIDVLKLLEVRQEHGGSLGGIQVELQGEALDPLDIPPFTQRYFRIKTGTGIGAYIMQSNIFNLSSVSSDTEAARTPESIGYLVAKPELIKEESPQEACQRLFDEMILTRDNLRGIYANEDPRKNKKTLIRLDKLKHLRIVQLLQLRRQHPDIGIGLETIPFKTIRFELPTASGTNLYFTETIRPHHRPEIWSKFNEYL